MAEPRRRVAIIGGSMAGLLAGLLLSRQGWEVDIFERSGAELASRGAGITPHQALFDAFHQAGIDIDKAMGVRSTGRTLLNARGGIEATNDTAQLFTSWGLLYRFLRNAFPRECYHNGAVVSDIRAGRNQVELKFAHGENLAVDWLIGADGSRSLLRNRYAPSAQTTYAGYIAWRGLVPEALLDDSVGSQLENRMTFYLPPGEHMLGYTVAGPSDSLERGRRWYNWVWYRPAPAGECYRQLFTDLNGDTHADGIPPQQINPAVIEAMRSDARRILPPQFAAAVECTQQPFLQPIVEVESERLVFGRAILIGDAAFTARPHIGLGVSKAAEDAATLATVFEFGHDDLVEALTPWERARLRFGRAVLKRSADLGCYLAGEPNNESEAQRFEQFRRPDIVLDGIAAAAPQKYLSIE